MSPPSSGSPAARHAAGFPNANTDAAAERPNVALSLTRRKAAAARMAPLGCGCRDPLECDLTRWCPARQGPRPRSRRGETWTISWFHGLGSCVCWVFGVPHPGPGGAEADGTEEAA